MATVSVNARRFGSGTISRNGTKLGMVRQAEVRFGKFLRLPYEETNSTGAVLFLGDDAELRAVLQGWDTDQRAALFPNVDGNNNPIWPGTTLAPGAAMTELTEVVFTPDDATAPSVRLRKCVAIPDPGIPLGARGGGSTIVAKTQLKYLDLEVTFVGLPDSGDLVGGMGPAGQV